jgi:hypothetical protein
MSEQDFNIRITLTPEQIVQAHKTFFEIAQNLEDVKKQATQDTDIQELVDREDHEVFRAMMYAAGLGDIDEFCGIVVEPTTEEEERPESDGGEIQQ